MKLSVIIPCYNEEARLPKTLESVAEYLTTVDYSTEVIVVDDGSSDKTSEAAWTFKSKIKNLDVLRFETNGGKGHAVKNGMLAAKGDLVVFMDADNSTRLSEIEKLEPYTNDFPVVIGSRHLDTSNVVIEQPWYRKVISRGGNLLIQSLIVWGIRDTQCGFKVFRKDVVKDIFERQLIMGFGFDMEILAISNTLGHDIKEVPVSWFNDENSKVRAIRDGFRVLGELFQIKLNQLRGRYK